MGLWRKKFYRLTHLPGFYIFLIVIITILSFFINAFPDMLLSIRFFSIGLIAVLAIILTSIELKRSTLRIDLENLLDLMIKSIFGSYENKYRSNIMLFDYHKKFLEIKYRSHQMKGALDRNLKINIDEYPDLCASLSILTGAPFWTNVANVQGHKKLLKENKVSKLIKSIFSTPIIDKNGIIIGVLNVDSNYTIMHSGLKDDKVYNRIIEYSDIIGENWIYW